MTKGDDYERKFANLLDKEPGWSVMRSGGSGGGTTDDRADLLVGNGDLVWAVEAKFSSDRNIYVSEDEADALKRCASGFNAEAMIAPRWHTRKVSATPEADWYPVPVDSLPQTDSGNYALNVEKITGRYEPLSYYL